MSGTPCLIESSIWLNDMPDITMCLGETCPKADTCYRSPSSGTKPDETKQSWFIQEPYWRDGRGPAVCDEYWPVNRETKDVKRG